MRRGVRGDECHHVEGDQEFGGGDCGEESERIRKRHRRERILCRKKDIGR